MSEATAFLAPEVGSSTLVEKTWGGTRLGALRGGPDHAGRTIGESWEFSTLPDRESTVAGSPLSQVLGGPLPFLAKLLDTADRLSVQVHPDDDPATGSGGKEEAWVVLEADPDACVWAGLREDLDPASFEDHVRRAAAGEEVPVLDDLQRIPVSTGTCILVPAGTAHAIGAGILLAEIQQPADCTYRLHDYGRPRPIHVDEGLAAYRVAARPTVWRPEDDEPGLLVGKHVRLEVVRDRTVERDGGSGPALLIPVIGSIAIQSDGAKELLGPAALRLWRGPGTLTVPGDGMVVVGTVR